MMHEPELSPPRLRARGLVVARSGRPIATLPDITVMAGQCVGLIGPSGTGKTTCLMAMAGITAPFGGAIAISGMDPWAMTSAARDRFRGRNIGLVFQSFHLVDALTVMGNLTLTAQCAHLSVDRDHVDLVMQALGIEDLGHRMIGSLSQGQVQRVAVARALINKPGLVLADEPSAALDDDNALGLVALLRQMAERFGIGLVIATHDRRILDRVDRCVSVGAPS